MLVNWLYIAHESPASLERVRIVYNDYCMVSWACGCVMSSPKQGKETCVCCACSSFQWLHAAQSWISASMIYHFSNGMLLPEYVLVWPLWECSDRDVIYSWSKSKVSSYRIHLLTESLRRLSVKVFYPAAYSRDNGVVLCMQAKRYLKRLISSGEAGCNPPWWS